MMVTWECTRKGCTQTTKQPDHCTEVGHQAPDGSYHVMKKRKGDR